MALTLVLDDFSGPLDLLWHLIKANEIDIYDIPIAEVTRQYLDYLHQAQELALDIAGDYFVMAASLMALKSRLLLPTVEEELQQDEPAFDPRADLVAQLLTYQVYQQAAETLKERAQERATAYAKPESNPPADSNALLAPGAVKLNELHHAMTQVVTQKLQTMTLIQHIEDEPVSVADQINVIRKRLKQQTRWAFDQLLDQTTVDGIVTAFLAILELMHLNEIECQQEDPFAPIWVQPKEAA